MKVEQLKLELIIKEGSVNESALAMGRRSDDLYDLIVLEKFKSSLPAHLATVCISTRRLRQHLRLRCWQMNMFGSGSAVG